MLLAVADFFSGFIPFLNFHSPLARSLVFLCVGDSWENRLVLVSRLE